MRRSRARGYDGRVPRLRSLAVSVAALIAIVALGAGAGGGVRAAWADESSTVAVIPLQAERRLALYGAPVASALAGALRTASFDVVLVSDTSVVPTRAWLVVDGRLVRTGGAIAIELRIRDPERAIDVARLAARAPALGEIDRVTRELAAELVATLERTRAAREAEREAERAARAAESEAARAAAERTASDPVAPAPPPVDPRTAPVDGRSLARVIVVGKPIRDRTGTVHDVVALGTPAAVALANRLGYRTAGGADRSGRESLVITIELYGLDAGFERDVPIGRARARVKVQAGAGVLFDRVVRTDTVVGSRGDRVDTLVRLVAAQVTDVVAPRIRERLGSRKP